MSAISPSLCLPQTKVDEYYVGEYDYGTVDGSQPDTGTDTTSPDQVAHLTSRLSNGKQQQQQQQRQMHH